MRKVVFLSIFGVLLLIIFFGLYFLNNSFKSPVTPVQIQKEIRISPPQPPKLTLNQPSQSKILTNDYHIFQTFNNCGPAALSMALSYFGININQQSLGRELRPYQNPQGDNDDKSVTLEELAKKAQELNLIAFHRPNGSIELIKYFITYDMPVIARTLTKPHEDIGHYRVVKGYDEGGRRVIQDDSLQNKNLWFSYEDFNILWEKFNFEYLVLVPKDKKEIAEVILGEDEDEKMAWKKAVDTTSQKLQENPQDVQERFNLAVALYYAGEYEKSVEEYERVENQLPFRTLWYQIEPILAYQKIKNYQRVFEITDKVLNNGNRAFAELYLIRGEIYLDLGKNEEAKKEFEQAVFYNQNSQEAKSALETI